jgi:RNA polymerase sigma factor (sigma-70 family)
MSIAASMASMMSDDRPSLDGPGDAMSGPGANARGKQRPGPPTPLAASQGASARNRPARRPVDLDAVLALTAIHGADANRIAKAMGRGRSSVWWALRRLERDGRVDCRRKARGAGVGAIPSAPTPPPLDPHALVLSVQPWVARLAQKHATSRARPDLADDLAGELLLKLVRLAPDYDPARGRPSTWAAAVARTEIPAAFARIAHAVSLPANCAGGRADPKLSPETRAKVDAAKVPAVRFASKWDAARRGPAECWADEPADHRGGPGAEAAVGRAEWMDRLRSAMAAVLTDREAGAIRRRYGLDGGRPETLAAIAKAEGVSREAIRQAVKRGVGKLREALGVSGGGEGDDPGEGE